MHRSRTGAPGDERGDGAFQVRLGQVLADPLAREPAHGVREGPVGLGEQPGRHQGPGPVEREHRQHPGRHLRVLPLDVAEGAQRRRQVTGEVLQHAEVVPGLGREPPVRSCARASARQARRSARAAPGAPRPCAAPRRLSVHPGDLLGLGRGVEHLQGAVRTPRARGRRGPCDAAAHRAGRPDVPRSRRGSSGSASVEQRQPRRDLPPLGLGEGGRHQHPAAQPVGLGPRDAVEHGERTAAGGAAATSGPHLRVRPTPAACSAVARASGADAGHSSKVGVTTAGGTGAAPHDELHQAAAQALHDEPAVVASRQAPVRGAARVPELDDGAAPREPASRRGAPGPRRRP